MSIKTAELITQSNKQAMNRQAQIASATSEVEAIFLKYDFNWEECGQVIDRLTERTIRVLGKITLKQIKKDYGRFN